MGAILYDSIILFGILMLAVGLIVLPYQAIWDTPYPHHVLLHRVVLQVVLVLVLISYFYYSWIHGGRTIGMRPWRCRLLNDDGRDLDRRNGLVDLSQT